MKWDYILSLVVFSVISVTFTRSPYSSLPILFFILSYISKGARVRGLSSISGVVFQAALLSPLTSSTPYTPLPAVLLTITSLLMLSSSLRDVEDPPWRVKKRPLLHTALLISVALVVYYAFVNFTGTGMAVNSLPVGRVFLVGAATLLTAGLFLAPKDIKMGST